MVIVMVYSSTWCGAGCLDGGCLVNELDRIKLVSRLLLTKRSSTATYRTSSCVVTMVLTADATRHGSIEWVRRSLATSSWVGSAAAILVDQKLDMLHLHDFAHQGQSAVSQRVLAERDGGCRLVAELMVLEHQCCHVGVDVGASSGVQLKDTTIAAYTSEVLLWTAARRCMMLVFLLK